MNEHLNINNIVGGLTNTFSEHLVVTILKFTHLWMRTEDRNMAAINDVTHLSEARAV